MGIESIRAIIAIAVIAIGGGIILLNSDLSDAEGILTAEV